MIRVNLSVMSTEQLLARFVEIGIKEERAELYRDLRASKRLYWAMQAVVQELKSRPGDARSELLKLYDHPSMQVRLKAAKATLAVAPQAARQALETIKHSNCYPEAGEAGMSLWALDEGIFVPS